VGMGRQEPERLRRRTPLVFPGEHWGLEAGDRVPMAMLV
jgi:hypothetical protein